ncbi:putative ATP-dependent acetyltransferase [Escherichia coli]|uniref:Putative ATP-dependent acetyltransferase n=1 Tax=Escherichia coli TaxID=562 RepID=A0A377DQA6_ECOLX|nr:putative ATP-dependent acetyltransferase [Escherichia coli]
MVSEALVFDDENFTHTPQGNIVISAFEQTLWQSDPETPLKVYQLLSVRTIGLRRWIYAG